MITGKYDVLEVSRHIINYSWEIGEPIDNLKLQKLLYFVQAFFMVVNKRIEACFKEEIYSWMYGPVVPCAYHEFKKFGSNNIERVFIYANMVIGPNGSRFENLLFVDNIIEKKDKMTINAVVDSLVNLSSIELVNITHKQQPWIEAQEGGQIRVISKDNIYEYYVKG